MINSNSRHRWHRAEPSHPRVHCDEKLIGKRSRSRATVATRRRQLTTANYAVQ